MSSAPKRLIEDEGYVGWRFEDELCQEVSDFWNGMKQSGYEFQAAIVGLVRTNHTETKNTTIVLINEPWMVLPPRGAPAKERLLRNDP